MVVHLAVGIKMGEGPAALSSFRGDAKHRTRNLEIPGLVLTHHPGMTFLSDPLSARQPKHHEQCAVEPFRCLVVE